MKKVLIIDDDSVLRQLVARWIVSAGWQVIEADDGEEGLRLAEEEQPQVVMTDLLMPRCNGFQVCRALRERTDMLRDVGIVVFTSSTYQSDRLNAYESGADEFLIKPLQRAEILEILERLSISGTEFLQRKNSEQGAQKPADANGGSEEPDRVEQEGMLIRQWGVRGSIPTPGPDTAHFGGNTTCVEVRADGQIIILDAGTGIRPLGLSMVQEFKNRPVAVTLLLTHTHWDHIQGFPFFVPAYNSRNRIRIFGYEGMKEGLSKTLSSQMESPYFPISLQSMPSYVQVEQLKDMEFSLGPVKIKAAFMNHPGICVGYRLETSCGTLVFIPDNEAHLRQKSMASPHLMTEKDRDGIEFARLQDEKLIEFVRDADVLIMDAQYDAEEYPGHMGWGHTCVDDTVAIALQANVKQLYLFHHDPGHDDAHITKMQEHARRIARRKGSPLKVNAAREGTCLVLPKPGA